MKIILLGPPGAGKGTQANFIKKHFDIPQISTGDMLRAVVKEKGELAHEVEQIMKSGQLVPDSIIFKLIKARITQKDCKNGYLFDGFPRNIAQAEEMQHLDIMIDCVIEIQVADTEIIRRISGRRIHPQSGRSYHIEFNPPKIAGRDDETGESLVQRDDDKAETVRARLEVYREHTSSLLDYYLEQSQRDHSNIKYIKINGMKSIHEIQKAIISSLN